MNRRQVVIFGLAAAVAGPSFASDFRDEIVASLRAQGYDQITVEVTFLGRVRITAVKQSNLREIVINPRTGEILRDLWLTADGRVAVNEPVFDDLDRTNSGRGNDDSDPQDSDGSDSNGSGDDSSDSGSSDNGDDDTSDDDAGDKSDRGGERD